MRDQPQRRCARLWHHAFPFCLLIFLVSGCITPSKARWQKIMAAGRANFTIGGTWQGASNSEPIRLNITNLPPMMAGTNAHGLVRVSYSPGLEAHASLAARLLDPAIAGTERQLGLPMPMRPHLFLVRLTNASQSLKFQLPVSTNLLTLPWPMPVTNSHYTAAPDPSPALLLSEIPHLLRHSFLLAHEMYEFRLFNPADPLACGDLRLSRGKFHLTFNYHTRWFREGYASYAGHHVLNALRQECISLGVDPASLQSTDEPFAPFSSLSTLKPKIFDWNQDQKVPNTSDYYGATLGLMLLAERRHSPEAIAAVIRKLPALKKPNGKNILKTFMSEGIDLKRLADKFQFPDLGLELGLPASGGVLIKAVRPESLAAVAGLETGDILQKINNLPVNSLASLEMAVFEAQESAKPICFDVTRNGQPRQLLMGH